MTAITGPIIPTAKLDPTAQSLPDIASGPLTGQLLVNLTTGAIGFRTNATFLGGTNKVRKTGEHLTWIEHASITTLALDDGDSVGQAVVGGAGGTMQLPYVSQVGRSFWLLNRSSGSIVVESRGPSTGVTINTIAAGNSIFVMRFDGTLDGTHAAWRVIYDSGAAGGGGGVSDGDKGDITISAGGTVYTIDPATVTLAKMANLAQDTLICRVTASTGVPETAALTAAGRSVIAGATVAAMVDTLGGAASTGTGGLVRETNPTVALASASTAVTQSPNDRSVKVATCLYVDTTRNRSKRNCRFYTDGVAAGDFATLTSGGTVTFNSGGVSDAAHPGVARCATGGASTNRAHITVDGTSIEFGTYAWDFESAIRINTLSSGTDRFIVIAGFSDSSSGVATDGAYWRYSDNVNSGKWECVTVSNGTETVNDSGLTADVGFHTFDVFVNSAGTSVEFWSDGALIHTHSSDIPTGSSRVTGVSVGVRKTVGTNSRIIDVDVVDVNGAISR